MGVEPLRHVLDADHERHTGNGDDDALGEQQFVAGGESRGDRDESASGQDGREGVRRAESIGRPEQGLTSATAFYGRLFEIAPAVKPLFRGDMTEQGRKLMATLGVVVNSLGNLEAVLPAASALAKRHVDYGVKAADYTPVGRRCAAVDAGLARAPGSRAGEARRRTITRSFPLFPAAESAGLRPRCRGRDEPNLGLR